MKTMPRPLLYALHITVSAMLAVIRRWEDKHAKHANHADYRMTDLNAGLWQAEQRLREIRTGHFEPMAHQNHWVVPQSTVLGKRYAEELLGGAPIPLYPVDK